MAQAAEASCTEHPLPMTGAQALVQSLIDQGVTVLFGYPGGAVIPIYDALYDFRGKVRHVLVRHEQGAAHAAEGFARATGQVGVCLTTSGPGATNAITALVDARMDSTPMVCITGQVHRTALGTEAFQEADIISMTRPATKWNYQIRQAIEIPEVIAHAFEVARSGRPGPVLVDVPKDVQAAKISPGTSFSSTAGAAWPGGPAARPQDLSALKRAADLINHAQRPYMVVGHGLLLAHAEQEVQALAERAGLPVASTLLGLSAFPTGHPLYVGMVGMHGNYGPNILVNQADVIIAVGVRFDDRVTGRLDTYAKQAKIIHIEIDPREINRHVPAEVALIADAKTALQALLPLIQPARHDEWISQFRQHDRDEYEKVIKPEIYPETGPLKIGEVVNQLSIKTHGTALVVSDVGQHQMFVARYYRFQSPLSYITSGGLGTMGYALPASIGAKFGMPDRQVIAVIGDGGFQMTIQELGTLMQEGIAVKIVIMNNGFLGMVRQWQEMFFDKRYSFVHMVSPDFVTIASGYGIAGQRVSERSQLEEAIDTLLNSEGSYLLEVVVDKEDKVFPMVAAGDSVSQVRLS